MGRPKEWGEEEMEGVANNLKWYRNIVKPSMMKEPVIVGAGRRYANEEPERRVGEDTPRV